MSDRERIVLTPSLVDHTSPEFLEISSWPYADEFVERLLKNDIPARSLWNEGRIWVYRDPSKAIVGFGTLDVCDDYRDYTAGRSHTYVPLLAVNPAAQGLGTSIMRHLIDEAAVRVRRGGCHDVLFLDVYEFSKAAIALYTKVRFQQPDDRANPGRRRGRETIGQAGVDRPELSSPPPSGDA